jgi:osomolarity two-component system sensor histidine kinase SLN1
MQEDDPLRLKRSLGIIYKSGDLLLNLLTDLLTFSKNQVGQHLSLDEKEFRLRDISSQTMAIFDKQARDGNIDLRVQYDGIRNGTKEISPDRQSNHGPSGTGPMRDMILWGDVHRILQVVINLMSNALKFTPPGETVVLTIRCLPEVPTGLGSRKTSTNSRHSRQPPSAKHRNSDLSVTTGQRMSTANAINVKDKPHALSYVTERATTPPPGRYVWFEFEVADTGPGMPENILEKIFEPFVQGDLGLSKKYGGTGLGLSICSQLAALMKGSMSVRSTLGQGSTFTLKVPLRHLHTRVDSSASSAMERPDISRSSSLDRVDREASLHSGHGPVEYRPDIPSPSESVGTISAPAAETSNTRLVGLSQPFFATNQPLESPNSQPAAMKQITASAARSGKIRVLVAEDNKVNQEVVLRMLKLEDIYDVTVAKDGQEALDMVKASMDGDGSPYNLIFMDVQMPNVDGLTSTRLIREIGYSAPIVALTAFAEESNIKDCLDSGMNYFLYVTHDRTPPPPAVVPRMLIPSFFPAAPNPSAAPNSRKSSRSTAPRSRKKTKKSGRRRPRSSGRPVALTPPWSWFRPPPTTTRPTPLVGCPQSTPSASPFRDFLLVPSVRTSSDLLRPVRWCLERGGEEGDSRPIPIPTSTL